MIWISAVASTKWNVGPSFLSSTAAVFHFAIDVLQCSITSSCNSTPTWKVVMQIRTIHAIDKKYSCVIRTVIERVGSKNRSNNARYIPSSTPDVQKRHRRIWDEIQSLDGRSIYMRSRYVNVAMLQWLIRMSNRFISLKMQINDEHQYAKSEILVRVVLLEERRICGPLVWSRPRRDHL